MVGALSWRYKSWLAAYSVLGILSWRYISWVASWVAAYSVLLALGD